MADTELLEFVPGAVYICDTDGVVVRYNRRPGELWGRYPIPGDPKELYCGSHRLYRDGSIVSWLRRQRQPADPEDTYGMCRVCRGM
jgi:PAS domain-containing protein